jgi:small subunit ribosomal protein S14
MATKARVAKMKKLAAIEASGKAVGNRHRNRCALCGRARGYVRLFDLCRICLRERADRNEIPGLKKSSW